jgi:hypothetical protein
MLTVWKGGRRCSKHSPSGTWLKIVVARSQSLIALPRSLPRSAVNIKTCRTTALFRRCLVGTVTSPPRSSANRPRHDKFSGCGFGCLLSPRSEKSGRLTAPVRRLSADARCSEKAAAQRGSSGPPACARPLWAPHQGLGARLSACTDIETICHISPYTRRWYIGSKLGGVVSGPARRSQVLGGSNAHCGYPFRSRPDGACRRREHGNRSKAKLQR